MENLFAKLLFKFFKTKANDIITYKLFKILLLLLNWQIKKCLYINGGLI